MRSNSKPVLELEIYLIRHGESLGNIGYNGRTDLTLREGCDPFLSAKGEIQAKAAGEYLKEMQFDAFYSSALFRAVQTASYIKAKQPDCAEKPLNLLPLLTETEIPPEYGGASLEELRSICPEAMLADGVDGTKPLVCFNAFEDEKGLFERAEKAVEYLRARYKKGEKIAVVSHAAFMTFFVFYIMGYRGKVPVYDINFKNTSFTRILFYKEGTNPYGDIVFDFINSVPHFEHIKD